MKHLVAARGIPESITTDNGSEFAGQAMDAWAHKAGVKLDFIRPGRPAGSERLHREFQRPLTGRMFEW